MYKKSTIGETLIKDNSSGIQKKEITRNIELDLLLKLSNELDFTCLAV